MKRPTIEEWIRTALHLTAYERKILLDELARRIKSIESE